MKVVTPYVTLVSRERRRKRWNRRLESGYLTHETEKVDGNSGRKIIRTRASKLQFNKSDTRQRYTICMGKEDQ
ncbi:hypothetical protein P879_11944 [Paragonimus westermani]|uniref:Uncharacterized protein n=1 Tax=Paragonimus westermani TaxID=34504 RepID=A0A8T0D4G5_9TREM|nr:hypothetical protein P879_11944 [Paragonimus westermani]